MKCEATIEFGDDFGDNHCTFHCQLENGHEGPHKEIGDMGVVKYRMPYTLTWEGNHLELEKTWETEDVALESSSCLKDIGHKEIECENLLVGE